MLPLLPHRREGAGRCRGHAHDEEGAGEKIRRQRRDRAGEVRCEPLRGGRIVKKPTRPPLPFSSFRNTAEKITSRKSVSSALATTPTPSHRCRSSLTWP